MNWLQLQHKLYTVARRQPPVDEVPYAFEKRVMARLRTPAKMEDLAAWARALWYSAAACAAVALLTSVWTYAPFGGNSASTFSFSEDLEQTIMASSDDSDGNWW